MVSARIISNIDDFEKHAEAWDGLLRASSSNTVFLSHAFLATWWKHFGNEREPYIITVEKDGMLAAAAPLCVRTYSVFGLPVRVLEIMGTGAVPTRPMGLSDRVDFAVRSGCEDAVPHIFDKIFEFQSRWDVAHFKGIQLKKSVLRLLATDENMSSQYRVTSILRYRSPFLTLKGTFDEYARNRSRNFRKQLGRYRRKLESLAPVEIVKDSEFSSEQLVMEFLRISARSWKGSRGSGLFINPVLRSFFTDLCSVFRSGNMLSVRFLKSGDQMIAHEICFRYSGKLYSYDSCFDHNYSSYSPGVILTASVLEEAFDAGISEYDMLRGDEKYKLRWSSDVREEHELTAAAPSLKTGFYNFVQMRMKPMLKNIRFIRDLDDRLSGLLNKVFRNR